MSTIFHLHTAFQEYRCLIKLVHLFLDLQNPTILESDIFYLEMFLSRGRFENDLRIPCVLRLQLVPGKEHWLRGDWVSQSAQAAVTKYHILGGLNNGIYFSQFLRLGSPRSRSQAIWFLVRALFLAYRCHLLVVSSHDGERALWSLFLSL